jgi:electron transfer flavoprotein beta subunit
LNSLGTDIGETVVNIAVLVKQVPDTNSKIQISGDRVDLSTVKMDISPYDEFAVENALQHKESGGGTVTAITVGPAGADKVLKGVKALGVDNIIRLDCDDYMDSNGLQSILEQEISSGGYDIVYCGKSAADTGAGSTGPGLAERLGWGSVSNITDITFDGGLTVTSPSEGGNAVIAVTLPAVVSCDKGSTKVRKSNVKGIMMAKRAQVDVKTVNAPVSSVSVVSQMMPPAKPAGKKFEGGESAQTVAQLLRDEANII